uniref:Uncharacterized protein n=1 Tax=Fagus sylvatica TaxID=28930 RepID=A0A2N9I9Z2_FAGSY
MSSTGGVFQGRSRSQKNRTDLLPISAACPLCGLLHFLASPSLNCSLPLGQFRVSRSLRLCLGYGLASRRCSRE